MALVVGVFTWYRKRQFKAPKELDSNNHVMEIIAEVLTGGAHRNQGGLMVLRTQPVEMRATARPV